MRNLANYACDITGNSPGTINTKGELVSYHPGAKQPWPCHHCDEMLPTNKMYTDHYKKKHNIREFLYFCKCGFSSITSRSVGSHMKYCDGTTPKEHLKAHKCEICKFSSDTYNGLQVHKSTRHKDEYNQTLKTKEKGYRWTNQEFEYLAKLVRKLKDNKVGQVNLRADKQMGRTEEAIQKIRQKPEYKLIEKTVIKREESKSEKGLSSSRTGKKEIKVQVKPDTPKERIRRALPKVPTPMEINDSLTSRMLNQGNLTIVNTPTITRKLPNIPQTPTKPWPGQESL